MYSRGLFWKIEGVNNDVYILGSIHFSDGSIYPLSRSIEGAFSESQKLVVEINALEPDPIGMQYAATQGIIDLSEGKTIRDFISEDTYELYRAVFAELDLPADVYKYLQPWRAYLLLHGLLLSEGPQSQISPMLGIDMRFLMKAQAASDKRIIELESIESQIDTMASFSPELQEHLLLETLLQFNRSDTAREDEEHATQMELLQFLEIFKTGDEAALEELMIVEPNDPFAKELNEKLFINRNIAIAEKINIFLQETTENGHYFIIIGAGHLLGTNGVIDLLTDMGHIVNRVK
jgi:uncharacterized protein YbaP (TraB family)